MSRRYSPDASLSRNQARTWVYRKCGADIDRALSWVDKTKAKTMLEMTTVDRSAILGATSRGDLNTIRSHFRQPVVMESIADINRRLLPAYATKLRANETPFIDYTRLSGRRSWLQELLLNQPAKGDHAHVFEWFFGEEAYEIVGDTVRSLLYPVFCRVMWASKYCMELTETFLTSHLFLSMIPIEKEFALSMMLMTAIESKKPSVVRLLVVHGASLMDPAKKLGCCAAGGDGLTAQMLFDCGVFGVVHQVFEQTVYKRTLDVAEVFLKNGMDAQAVPDENAPLVAAAVCAVCPSLWRCSWCKTLQM